MLKPKSHNSTPRGGRTPQEQSSRKQLLMLASIINKEHPACAMGRVIPICEFFLEWEQTPLNIPVCLGVHKEPGEHKSGGILLLEGPRHTESDAHGDDLGKQGCWFWGGSQGCPHTRVWWRYPLGGGGTASLPRPCVNDLAAADRSSPSAFLSHWMISLKPKLGKMPLMLP